jgi:hypothetical protein
MINQVGSTQYSGIHTVSEKVKDDDKLTPEEICQMVTRALFMGDFTNTMIRNIMEQSRDDEA